MFFNHQQCFFIIEHCFLDYTMCLSDCTIFLCDCRMFVADYMILFLEFTFCFLQQQFAPHLPWCQYDDILNDINSVTQIPTHDHKSRIIMSNWWSQLYLWLKLTTTGNVCNTVFCAISHGNLLSEHCFYKLNIVFFQTKHCFLQTEHCFRRLNIVICDINIVIFVLYYMHRLASSESSCWRCARQNVLM